MTIKAHCMGMGFPKRDTDGPNITWRRMEDYGLRAHVPAEHVMTAKKRLPSAADLDAVAEERRIKEATSARIP